MHDSSDSPERQDDSDTPEGARWRRLLELLERIEIRRRYDRETSDSIWRQEQDRAETARAELAGLVRGIPTRLTRTLLEALPRHVRWPWWLVAAGTGLLLVGAALGAVGAILALRW